MKFIADLHIHSRYSRATAKNLNLENLYVEARNKGLTVVATGDFTHPAWFAELQDKLVPAETGLFRLRSDLASGCDAQIPSACQGNVRFLLETEISNIYKKGERTRKNHNLVFMPDLESARRFNQRLEQIGNIHSDGRPILGLDARDLMETVLETDSEAHLIPAHVWTPWFSLLGSKSGFDSVEACFGDLSHHIFALETGLSSDPPMNWRVSALDQFTLVSNSDAHSPAKLGREANCFDTELSYEAIFEALKKPSAGNFKGTIEFYPEEGKYHADGHRKCGVQLLPDETRRYDGLCPVCGKPLVLGVLHRVEALSDRPVGFRPATSAEFVHLVPLEDMLAQLLRVGPKSKRVTLARQRLLESYGPELSILRDLPLEALLSCEIPHLGEAIGRMRNREITFSPGYDGEYGRLNIFSPDEWARLDGQRRLFATGVEPAKAVTAAPAPLPRVSANADASMSQPLSRVLAAIDGAERAAPTATATAPATIQLNPEQQQVIDHRNGPVIVVAGPGTGKTRVLTERIVHLVNDAEVPADTILAVTFTQKAATEMRERLAGRLGGSGGPLVATFHGLCLQLLQEKDRGSLPVEKETPSNTPAASQPVRFIISGDRQAALMGDALKLAATADPTSDTISIKAALRAVSSVKQGLLPPDAPRKDLLAAADGRDISAAYPTYQRLLGQLGAWDYDDLIFEVVSLLEKDADFRQSCRERFPYLFVDEYQDLNAGQYRIVRALCPGHSQLCVIGDPDQAIYGFRGARVTYFNRFLEDYPGARVVHLRRNYRSVQTVLSAAYEVIANQHISLTGSGDDRPVAQMPGSLPICEMAAATERSEAVAIGKTIEQLVGGTGFHHLDFGSVKDQSAARQLSFGDVAVLYRTHQQGVQLAAQLGKGGIPCQIASRGHLLEEPLIAALVALVQLMNNSAAFSDFETAAGALKAGIGPKTLQQVKRWAYHKGLGLSDALVAARRIPLPGISLARQQNLFDFIQRLDELRRPLDRLPLVEQLRHLIDHSAIGGRFGADETTTQALDLLLQKAAAAEMDRARLLENLALLEDTDYYDPRAERVALMTLHAAKGLEFPVVFIAGCEDGYLPISRGAPDADVDLAEERRLLYVGMTRARQRLFLSRARKRRVHGKLQVRDRSPFLADIPDDLLAPWDRNQHPKKPPRQQQLALFD
ncbi:MAG: UvrD-helicase domain-containing protein [Desulfosarcinaceae bacterium]|nr:UvrD-helicase domain-containing protein [Desulfosarcinaceae bacterium]